MNLHIVLVRALGIPDEVPAGTQHYALDDGWTCDGVPCLACGSGTGFISKGGDQAFRFCCTACMLQRGQGGKCTAGLSEHSYRLPAWNGRSFDDPEEFCAEARTVHTSDILLSRIIYGLRLRPIYRGYTTGATGVMV